MGNIHMKLFQIWTTVVQKEMLFKEKVYRQHTMDKEEMLYEGN